MMLDSWDWISFTLGVTTGFAAVGAVGLFVGCVAFGEGDCEDEHATMNTNITKEQQ